MSQNNNAIVEQNLSSIDLKKAYEDLENPETIFAQDEDEEDDDGEIPDEYSDYEDLDDELEPIDYSGYEGETLSFNA
jgi:hypothetical protein